MIVLGDRRSGKSSLIEIIANTIKGSSASNSVGEKRGRSQESNSSRKRKGHIKSSIKTNKKWKEDEGSQSSSKSSQSSSNKLRLGFKKTEGYSRNGSLDKDIIKTSYFEKLNS